MSFEPPLAGTPVDEVLFGTNRLVNEARRVKLLVRALREFDVVHFNFGSTLLPKRYPTMGAIPSAYAALVEFRDLALLRRAGKAICVTFQGDDARQRHGDRKLAARQQAWIESFDRYAHRLYALNPDLLHVLPDRAEFLPYASVDPSLWRPAGEIPKREQPIVLHAPSDREVKGTGHILEALEQLEREGVRFELRLVEGLQRAEARSLYEGADLVVDQVLVGWYGGFAVEAMALGKPVVAFLREEDVALVPQAMRDDIPVISAGADSLATTLRDWLTWRRPELEEVGRRSRSFVERWHDPRTIAERLKRDYEEILAERRT